VCCLACVSYRYLPIRWFNVSVKEKKKGKPSG